MPNSRGGETSVRFQMQIESGRVDFSHSAMRKIHSDMGLVWALVFGKTNVPVNSKERPTVRLGIGYKIRIDFPQMRREICDELQRRTANILFVSFPIGKKPVAIIVPFKLLKKTEQLL